MEAIQKRLRLSPQDVEKLIQMKNTFVKAMEDWCEDQPEAITYTPTDPSGLSFSVPDEDVRAWYAASHFDQNPYRVNEKGIRHIISFTGVAKFQIA